jgi:two-component system, NtrC family, sensor kinase
MSPTNFSYNHTVNRWLSRLQVSQKIGIGYAITLLVAITGTSIGFIIVDKRYQSVLQHQKDSVEELEVIHNLMYQAAEVKKHQLLFASLLDKPQDLSNNYKYFLAHKKEFQKAWKDFGLLGNKFRQHHDYDYQEHVNEIKKILDKHEQVPKLYLEEVDRFVNEVNFNYQSKDINVQKLKIINFVENPVAISLNNFSRDLQTLRLKVLAENENNQSEYKTIENIRILITTVIMLLSVACAIVISIYISRAIAHPLQITTQTAEIIANKSDFSLKVPIITEDEIGILAKVINQLIERVENLLKAQESYSQNLEQIVYKRTEALHQKNQELNNTLQELKQTQAQLIQNEKMSSLGQLVGGIAHEINNPVNFIHGNIDCTKQYIQDICKLLQMYQLEYPNPPQSIQDEILEIDLDFIVEDLQKSLKSMHTGTTRIRDIIISLRNFSRLDESDIKTVDVHEGIESSLIILQSRFKAIGTRPKIEIIRNYSQLPDIECYPGQLNQAIMSLLNNAVDALENQQTPSINISTKLIDKHIHIYIIDNGIGMTEEVTAKSFDPFFTTKPIGQGTGLGLSITHKIIVEQHKGKLYCNSTPNQGTEFIIELPIK